MARDVSESGTEPAESEPAPRAYYLVNAVMRGIDDSGATTFRIHVDRIEQSSANEPLQLTAIRIESAEGSGVDWDVSAASGTAPADTSSLSLNRVSAVRRSEPGRIDAGFDTDSLEIDIRNSRLSTEADVEFRTSEWTNTATGLKLDLKTNTYEFVSNDKTIFRP